MPRPYAMSRDLRNVERLERAIRLQGAPAVHTWQPQSAAATLVATKIPLEKWTIRALATPSRFPVKVCA